MSRRRILPLAVALGLIVLSGLAIGPAGADDITGKVERVGWWTNRLGAQPTTAPASFEVSFGTDLEPTSVAALDVSMPVQPVQALQLSLTELAGTANGIGHIRVCLAAPGWASANAGKLDQAPAFDCTTAADLTRSLDGNWLGDITGLVPNGGTASLGLVLVDDLALGTPVSLAATVQISTITITGESGDSIAPTDTTPTTAAPVSGFDDSFSEPSPGFIPPADFDVPSLDPPTPAATPPTTVELAEAPEPLLPASFDHEGKPWWRVVLIAPLALAMGFATIYSRRLLEARGVNLSS